MIDSLSFAIALASKQVGESTAVLHSVKCLSNIKDTSSYSNGVFFKTYEGTLFRSSVLSNCSEFRGTGKTSMLVE